MELHAPARPLGQIDTYGTPANPQKPAGRY